LILEFMAARAIRSVEEVVDRTYLRTVHVDEGIGVIEIEPGGSDHLIMRAHLPRWEGLIHIVRRVRRIFNLDVDVNSAVNVLGHDHLIGGLVRARPGLRPPGAWDPFEVGVRAILGQQVSVAGASTMTSRMVERVGMQVQELGDSRLSHVFPSPDAVAEADLDGLGLTSARVRALRAFAGAAANGSIRWDQGVDMDELVSSLTALPGIGPWTAQYIALRLGRRDAFPASDLGLRRAVARLSSNGAAKELGKLAEPWRPWRSHAAIHLWTA
jgi:AraC family transcriptional regulator, regulatory protein of adaptative response / DNA-3-methyladenine glycosylase II